MADFGLGPYGWLTDDSKPFPPVGTNIADSVSGFKGKFSVSAVLHKDFAKWVTQFENEYDNPSFDWKAFHKTGRKLSGRLKKEIGHLATIYYVKPVEDPNYKEDKITLI